MRPTHEEIATEIAALRAVKTRVPMYGFGGNNHASIDAQVAVLERGMSNDEIYDRWDGDDVCSDAISAMEWRTHGGEAPSVGWQEIAS